MIIPLTPIEKKEAEKLDKEAIEFIEDGKELTIENIIDNEDNKIQYEFYKNINLLDKIRK